MIVVQAAPNTQPGGVHGALFNERYHSETTPFSVKNPPITNAPKLIAKNRMILTNITPRFNLYTIVKLIQVTKKDVVLLPKFFKELLNAY
jgi:hypothetical protein